MQGDDGLPGIRGPPALPGLEVRATALLSIISSLLISRHPHQHFSILSFQGLPGEMGPQGPPGPAGAPVSV